MAISAFPSMLSVAIYRECKARCQLANAPIHDWIYNFLQAQEKDNPVDAVAAAARTAESKARRKRDRNSWIYRLLQAQKKYDPIGAVANAAAAVIAAKATTLAADRAEAKYNVLKKADIAALNFLDDLKADPSTSTAQKTAAIQAAITAEYVSSAALDAMFAAKKLALLFEEEVAITEQIAKLPPSPLICWYCQNEEDMAVELKSYARGWIITRCEWCFVCMQCHYWHEENKNNMFKCL